MQKFILYLFIISLLSKIIHIHRLWTDTYLILHVAVRVRKFNSGRLCLHMLLKTGDIQRWEFSLHVNP
jgi:hypothetical protein